MDGTNDYKVITSDAGQTAYAKAVAEGLIEFLGLKQMVSVTAEKTVDELAREVISGLWGNGSERKAKLTAAGYDYSAIQARVNELVKGASAAAAAPAKKSNEEIAKEVTMGLWGNGSERKQRLADAGYDYKTIQAIVNELCKR